MVPVCAFSQSNPHFTMFMFNKLLFNPAYAGSRDLTSVDASYRDQWTGIAGAPKTLNVTADGPVGSYMKSFRSVAIGIGLTSEQLGVEKNTDVVAYYAYRIKLEKSILSFGLDAGVKVYSADYSQLNLVSTNDPQFAQNVKNALLPNFGAGVYWSGDNFYMGFAIPNLLQNYYDKADRHLDNENAREIRSYYLDGGYVFPVNETIKLEPQLMFRYAKNALYQLPLNCDINLSAIIYDRLLIGATYRTDKSFEAIAHIQVTRSINIGYAYDYSVSALNGYNGGTHEIVLGYNFIKDASKYATPRFTRAF